MARGAVRRIRMFLWGLPALLTLAACGGDRQTPAPEVLRVSAIPDQSPERVQFQHEAVVREACALAGLRCEFRLVKTYEALVDQLGSGDLDVAFLGGVTFSQAYTRHRVEPLVMRDIDLNFTSLVLVRTEAAARSLADLKGRRFSFGNRSSTSGHFMARSMLGREGIEPERYFASVGFSGTHDATMRLVQSGQVEAGAVNSSVFFKAQAAGDPVARGLRVLWQSPPFADYVWSVRRTLPVEVRERLKNAFLDLNRSVPEQRQALDRHGAVLGFVPAYPADFDDVMRIVGQQGSL